MSASNFALIYNIWIIQRIYVFQYAQVTIMPISCQKIVYKHVQLHFMLMLQIINALKYVRQENLQMILQKLAYLLVLLKV